jgi:hypothetical protein
VDLTKAKGVLSGLHGRLSHDESKYLSDEFQAYYADVYAWRVTKAGKHIFCSLTKENALDPELVSFQGDFVELLRDATRDNVVPRCDCAFHKQLLALLKTQLSLRQHLWLMNFLDVLTASNERLHAYLPGHKVADTNGERLSRFMLLTKFIEHHTTTTGTIARKDLFDTAVEKLAPHCNPFERHDLLKNRKGFGLLKGEIGSYGNEIGAMIRREPCKGIKPFSTFSTNVRKRCPDSSSVELILNELGVPFEKGQVWVELQFSAAAAVVDFKTQGLALACPTVVDARGNWAFRPDRAPGGSTGLARNLKNNKKGMPEVIHNLVPISLLDDAIVWPETTYGWGSGSTLAK